jgi:hypothetical protein
MWFRDNLLKKKWGLTIGDLARMLSDQRFRCGVCENPIDEVTRHVDHDHRSGKIRGLLCHGCNVSLGHFDDSIETLEKAIAYLRRYRAPEKKEAKS